MTSGPDKPKDTAEEAYAAAAAKATPAKPAPAKKKPAAVKAKKLTRPRRIAKVPAKAAPTVAPAKSVAPVVAAVSEPVVTDVETLPAKSAVPEVETPAPLEFNPPKPTITELKEKIMATAKTPDFTKPVTDAVADLQSKAKVAYEKGTEAMTEATEFAKGNVEAIVESGKILAAGAQDLGKTYVEEAKSAYETLTADLKEMAAIKSPTELFQLQGKIMRRNFDALVATSSKNTEAVMKLANDSFAPISGRVNLAAEKLAKVA
jgi:phasin family protein